MYEMDCSMKFWIGRVWARSLRELCFPFNEYHSCSRVFCCIKTPNHRIFFYVNHFVVQRKNSSRNQKERFLLAESTTSPFN